jgi:hypothetical protein
MRYRDISGMTASVLADIEVELAQYPDWRFVQRERVRVRRANGSPVNRYHVIVRDLTTGAQAEITGRDTWAAWKATHAVNGEVRRVSGKT